MREESEDTNAEKAIDAMLGIEAMRECALQLVKLDPRMQRSVIAWLADYFLGERVGPR